MIPPDENRLKICKFCVHYNTITKTCYKLDKIIPIYYKRNGNHCPIGKW